MYVLISAGQIIDQVKFKLAELNYTNSCITSVNFETPTCFIIEESLGKRVNTQQRHSDVRNSVRVIRHFSYTGAWTPNMTCVVHVPKWRKVVNNTTFEQKIA